MRCISYLRVSTQRQGSNGLGVEAQRQAVADYIRSTGGALVAEFVEVESGTNNARPKLEEALRACRLHGARLVIARLDRLSRNATFLLNLQDSGVDFVACDNPSCSRLTLGVLALVAEQERRLISERTKAALQAARARGVKLGNPQNLGNRAAGQAKGKAILQARAKTHAADLAETIRAIQAKGISTGRGIADELNRLGIPSARGGEWHQRTVARVLDRMEG